MSRAATAGEKRRARGALLIVGAFVGLVGATMLIPTSASAQSDKYTDETVSPTIIITSSPSTPPDDSTVLPFTGADLSLFVATGAAAIGTGAVIVRRTRRKPSEDE